MTTTQQDCPHVPGSSRKKHSRTCLSGVSPSAFVLLFTRLFLGFHTENSLRSWAGGLGLGGVVVWICAGNREHNTGIFLLLLSRVWGRDHSLWSFSSAQPSSGKNLLIPSLTLPHTTGNTHQIPSPGQLYFLQKKKNRDKKPHFHQEHLIPFPPTSKGKTNRYFM